MALVELLEDVIHSGHGWQSDGIMPEVVLLDEVGKVMLPARKASVTTKAQAPVAPDVPGGMVAVSDFLTAVSNGDWEFVATPDGTVTAYDKATGMATIPKLTAEQVGFLAAHGIPMRKIVAAAPTMTFPNGAKVEMAGGSERMVSAGQGKVYEVPIDEAEQGDVQEEGSMLWDRAKVEAEAPPQRRRRVKKAPVATSPGPESSHANGSDVALMDEVE